ncbi:hypothetical protein [Halostagnicola kamekurae]|uniref:Uncharacterized protein n=1 Tax=Halostagnicola kamekurae TaxID=619731 RepID=A0A1I6SNY1_9EURY|nr:hypothetical protein [Halostagnicola kamekurae]SFS78663.1 hypothetical protein SAMN04488556_2816 [Halostagnicola kamekurae]
MSDYDPEDLPRTDGLELALLSEAENAEDYRDLWGTILDDEVFKKIDDKLTDGEADLDVNSLSSAEARIGESPAYRYVSNGGVEVTVPDDYDTIQEAIDAAPKRLRHLYRINVEDGDYDDEDLLLRGFSSEGYQDNGEHGQIQIWGDSDDPSNVKVRSAAVVGCSGVETPQLVGLSFSGQETPYVDESTCVSISGCREGWMKDCEFREGDASDAITAYRSGFRVISTNFGEDYYDKAVRGKRASLITAERLEGSVNYIFHTLQMALYFEEDMEDINGEYQLNSGGLRSDEDTLYTDRLDVNELAIDSIRYLEPVDKIDKTDSFITVPFDELDIGEYLLLRITQLGLDDAGEVLLKTDAIGDGEYGHRLNDGSTSFENDAWTVLDGGASNTRANGDLKIKCGYGRVGVSNVSLGVSRMDGGQVHGDATWIEDGYSEPAFPNPTKITFQMSGDATEIDLTATVYKGRLTEE